MEFEALRVSTSLRPKAKARGEEAPGSGTSSGRLPVLAPARGPGAASCLLQAPQPSSPQGRGTLPFLRTHFGLFRFCKIILYPPFTGDEADTERGVRGAGDYEMTRGTGPGSLPPPTTEGGSRPYEIVLKAEFIPPPQLYMKEIMWARF